MQTSCFSPAFVLFLVGFVFGQGLSEYYLFSVVSFCQIITNSRTQIFQGFMNSFVSGGSICAPLPTPLIYPLEHRPYIRSKMDAALYKPLHQIRSCHPFPTNVLYNVSTTNGYPADDDWRW